MLGLAIATLNGRGFAGPNIFAAQATETPRAVLRAFPGAELYSAHLLLLPLQQLHRPPSEEVCRVALVLQGARLGRRALVPHQRGLPDQVGQGAVVTLGADIADV